MVFDILIISAYISISPVTRTIYAVIQQICGEWTTFVIGKKIKNKNFKKASTCKSPVQVKYDVTFPQDNLTLLYLISSIRLGRIFKIWIRSTRTVSAKTTKQWGCQLHNSVQQLSSSTYSLPKILLSNKLHFLILTEESTCAVSANNIFSTNE